MSEDNEIRELRRLITAHLNSCDPVTTPAVCEMKATADGIRQLEDDIIARCSSRGLSVGQAVLEIERQYNSNWTEQ